MVSQSRADMDINHNDCGPLAIAEAMGPYDYRSDKARLPVVEETHLTPEVIRLVPQYMGSTTGGHLDYTLRIFPNHHVALMTMIRLGEKEKRAKPAGAKYTVECYLKRAVRFRNDDATVRILYASYLSKARRKAEALSQLNEAAQLGIEGANANYNMGLISYDLNEYEKALFYAHQAYRLGYPLLGLRDKLKRVGKWKEPDIQSEDSGK